MLRKGGSCRAGLGSAWQPIRSPVVCASRVSSVDAVIQWRYRASGHSGHRAVRSKERCRFSYPQGGKGRVSHRIRSHPSSFCIHTVCPASLLHSDMGFRVVTLVIRNSNWIFTPLRSDYSKSVLTTLEMLEWPWARAQCSGCVCSRRLLGRPSSFVHSWPLSRFLVRTGWHRWWWQSV